MIKTATQKADFRIFLKSRKIKIQQSTNYYIKIIQTYKYFNSRCNQLKTPNK